MKFDQFVLAVLRCRWVVIVFATLLMAAATFGVRHIGQTNDFRSLFDEDDLQLAALNDFEDIYGASDTLLIAAAPDGGSIFTGEALTAMQFLTDVAWTAPYSTRVDSLTNYSHSEGRQDELLVEHLVSDASKLDKAGLARVQDIALSAPEVAGRLVSLDGAVGGLAITFALPEDPDAAVAEITDYIGNALDRARAEYPGISFYVTGNVPLNRVFAAATEGDLKTLGPIAFLLIAIAAAALLRSVIGTVAIVVFLGFVVNTTLGLAGWLGTVFNPASSGVPIIVMTVAVAHAVHIVDSLLSGLGEVKDRNQAVIEAMRVNAWPVFLTSLTTAIGFLSLNFSDSPPFRVLGTLVAVGVAIAFVFSLTFLPAFLSVLPFRARQGSPKSHSFFDRLGSFVVAKPTILLICSAATVIAIMTGIPRIELSDDWTRYFSERHEFRRDTDFVIDNLDGVSALDYSLNSGSAGGITDPAYLERVETLADWFRSQPEVTNVQVFTDVMKRLNKNMNGDDPAFYQIPESQELAAQYLLLYEFSLPFGSDLNNSIDIAKSLTRMTVFTGGLSSAGQSALDGRAMDWIAENSPGLAGPATGVSILFAHLSERNIKSMLTGTIVAMAIISFILIFVCRSLRLGLVSLLPNFIPAALAFGLWGYLVGRVGLAGSVITAVAFGIIVDDTIHFLTNYLRFRRGGHSSSESVLETFRTVGHALCTTTVVLALGFLVFATSSFEVSSVLGMLVSITLAFALLADFLLLPPMLMALDRKPHQPIA